MSDIDDIIDAVAAGPASAGNKSENATAQRLTDLIAVKKSRAADTALANPARFLSKATVKLIPPGGS